MPHVLAGLWGGAIMYLVDAAAPIKIFKNSDKI
jgi:hypothetical protein